MLINPKKHALGQSMVEFALILPVLMLIIMGLFEFGRMLQVWLTLQYSAQAAARYASTGQEGVDPSLDKWDSVRLAAIKAEAQKNAVTLGIQPSAGQLDPGYFQVYVYASDTPIVGKEYPGGPRARVIVDIVFNHSLITPLGTMLGRYATLKAHSEMIVERFRFPGYGTPAGTLPPTIPPTPTPTNTPIPTWTPVPTDTSVPSDTPTLTPTP
jgi:Flp pilus assembly protein TadG